MEDLELEPEELARRLREGDGPTLVDVRTEREAALCTLPGSVLVPLEDDFSEQMQDYDPDEELVLYCHHGVRSLNAARLLQQRGFRAARSLAGGIDAWSRRVDPETPRY